MPIIAFATIGLVIGVFFFTGGGLVAVASYLTGQIKKENKIKYNQLSDKLDSMTKEYEFDDELSQKMNENKNNTNILETFETDFKNSKK